MAKRPAAATAPAAGRRAAKPPAAAKGPAAKRGRHAAVADRASGPKFDDLFGEAPEVLQGWHKRNVNFWKTQSTNVKGATGGGITRVDLAFTREVVQVVADRVGRRFSRVLDCGAGIGRVSESVLRHHSAHIDLVEFVKKHLVQARESLRAKEKGDCTFSFHTSSIQKFEIKLKCYDLVWCQWWWTF